MKPVAVILNDKELVRLLTNLNLPTDFPQFRPAPKTSPHYGPAPPDEQCQLDARVDLYDAIDTSPADD